MFYSQARKAIPTQRYVLYITDPTTTRQFTEYRRSTVLHMIFTEPAIFSWSRPIEETPSEHIKEMFLHIFTRKIKRLSLPRSTIIHRALVTLRVSMAPWPCDIVLVKTILD